MIGSLELGIIRSIMGNCKNKDGMEVYKPGDTAYVEINPGRLNPGRHTVQLSILDVNGLGPDNNLTDNILDYVFVQTEDQYRY